MAETWTAEDEALFLSLTSQAAEEARRYYSRRMPTPEVSEEKPSDRRQMQQREEWGGQIHQQHTANDFTPAAQQRTPGETAPSPYSREVYDDTCTRDAGEADRRETEFFPSGAKQMESAVFHQAVPNKNERSRSSAGESRSQAVPSRSPVQRSRRSQRLQGTGTARTASGFGEEKGTSNTAGRNRSHFSTTGRMNGGKFSDTQGRNIPFSQIPQENNLNQDAFRQDDDPPFYSRQWQIPQDAAENASREAFAVGEPASTGAGAQDFRFEEKAVEYTSQPGPEKDETVRGQSSFQNRQEQHSPPEEGLFGGISKMLERMDREALLIAAVLLLLYQKQADQKLILALVYILIG